MDPDADLVPGLHAQEPRALETLFRRHGDGVWRTCRRILGQHAEAEDALQDVFLKLQERGPQFRGRSRLRTWIYRLTVNVCLHRRERESLRRTADLDGPALHAEDSLPTPYEAAARHDDHRALERWLQALPLEQRLVLHLREVEDLSYREISAALGVPEGTVMSRLSRARARLAEWLAPAPENASPEVHP